MKIMVIIGVFIALSSALSHESNDADQHWNQWRKWSKPMWGMVIGLIIFFTSVIYI